MEDGEFTSSVPSLENADPDARGHQTAGEMRIKSNVRSQDWRQQQSLGDKQIRVKHLKTHTHTHTHSCRASYCPRGKMRLQLLLSVILLQRS